MSFKFEVKSREWDTKTQKFLCKSASKNSKQITEYTNSKIKLSTIQQ